MPSPLRQTALRSNSLALLSAVAVLAGCGTETPTAPTDVTPQLSAVAGGPGVAASVVGGAHFQLEDPPAFVGPFKWVYAFSFNVQELADGADQGRVTFRSKIPDGQNTIDFPGDWWAQIAIDCLEVDGNVAWMTGTVTDARTDSPLGPGEGDYGMLIVRDNGPTGPDEVNVGPVGAFGATDCRDRPPVFPGGWTDGNVTVASW